MIHIKRIELENFRSFTSPVAIELTQGLNVLHGPNEVGKTTIVEALWHGLLTRPDRKNQVTESLQPRESKAWPTTRLDFEVDGVDYSLRKAFGTAGSMRLIRTRDGSREELGDAAALEAVAGLFDLPPKFGKPADTRDTGAIWLSWVKQGAAGGEPGADITEYTEGGIKEQLARLSEEVLAGADGSAIYDSARAAYLEFFTPSGGERSGADARLKMARASSEDAAQAHEALKQLEETHGRLLEQRDAADRKLAEHRASVPKLRATVREREEALGELEKLEAERKTRAAVEQQREAELAGLVERERLRATLLEQTAELERKLEELSDQQAVAIADLEEARKSQGTARKRFETEKERVQDLERELRAVERLVGLVDAESNRRQLAASLEDANMIRSALLDARAAAQAISLDENTVNRLDELTSELRDARVRLEAAAARVVVSAESVVQLELDGEAVSIETGEPMERIVTDSLIVRLPGTLGLQIQAGQGSVADLRTAVDAHEQAVSVALGEAGVESLAEAKSQLRERSDREGRVQTLETRIEMLAPGGVDALQTKVGTLDHELTQERSRLEEVGVDCAALGAEDLLAERSALRTRADELETVVEGARQALGGAEDARAEFDAEVQGLEVSQSGVAAELVASSERHEEAAQALAKEREALDDAELKTKVNEAKQKLADAAADRAKAEESLGAGVLEGATRGLEDATKAVESKQKEISKLEQDRAELNGRLGEQDVEKLHERLAVAQNARDVAEAKQKRAEFEAATARLLFETLEHRKEESEARFLAPLQTDVAELLSQLWPNATIELDSKLCIERVVRPGKPGLEFDALSAGAREQLGIIVRLSMTRLLAKVQPVVVVLDDSLVVTDDERFRDVARVINYVARDLQVLFLTCHWPRQGDLGLAADNVVDIGSVRALADAG